MKTLQKINAFLEATEKRLGKIALFVIGWIIAFDTIAGTLIPISYGKGCGWFAIPNLMIDICVILLFVKLIKDEGAN